MRNYIILFCFLLLVETNLYCQSSSEIACDIYAIVFKNIKGEIAEYGERKLFVSMNTQVIEDYAGYFKHASPLFNDSLIKYNINYNKFVVFNTHKEFICTRKEIKQIYESEYRVKYNKCRRKAISLCTFSNIGYYDNYFTLFVTVELSYGRRYVNFYFLKKDAQLVIIYSKTGCD